MTGSQTQTQTVPSLVISDGSFYELYTNATMPANMLILDIRSHVEFSQGHVINAINVPFQRNFTKSQKSQILSGMELRSKKRSWKPLNYWIICNQIQLKSIFIDKDAQIIDFVNAFRDLTQYDIHVLNISFETWNQRCFYFNTNPNTNTEANVNANTNSSDTKNDNNDKNDNNNSIRDGHTNNEHIENENDNHLFVDELIKSTNTELARYLSYPSCIIGGQLYLGTSGHARNAKIFKNLKFTHVLNVTAEEDNFFEGNPDIDIQYLRISLVDHERSQISDHFPIAIEFIHNALNGNANENENADSTHDHDRSHINKNCVYIHCHAGVSRSPTITIAYLMQTRQMSYQKAHVFVKSKRDHICPNQAFTQQLMQFEKVCARQNTTTK